jgi:hypothetical protein
LRDGLAIHGAAVEPRAVAQLARELELECQCHRRQRRERRALAALQRLDEQRVETLVRLLAPHQPVHQLERRLRVRQPREIGDARAERVHDLGAREQVQVAIGLEIEDEARSRQWLERVAEPAGRLPGALRHELPEPVLARVDRHDAARVAERVGLQDDAFGGDDGHGVWGGGGRRCGAERAV